MLVTDGGRRTSSKPWHSENADSGTVVTEGGISIDTNAPRFWNAKRGMEAVDGCIVAWTTSNGIVAPSEYTKGESGAQIIVARFVLLFVSVSVSVGVLVPVVA